MNGRILTAPDDPIPRRARCLLGNRTGIVGSLLHYLPDRADPTVFYATAVESDVGRVAGREVGSLEAGGTGLAFAESAMSALGEAMERYSLYVGDASSLVETSHRDLAGSGRRTIPFKYLSIYDEARLRRAGFEPLTPDATIPWQPATDLLTGEEVYVPAELVWLGSIGGAVEAHFPTTSNGCACGDSPEMALVAALSECVERDAIMRAWYTRGETRGISLEECPGLESALERVESDVLAMRCFEVESAIDVPVVGCAAVDDRDRAPKFALGGASSLDRTRAYVGAILEAAQTFVYLKDLIAGGDADDAVDPDRIFDLRDNLLYYARPENFTEVEFLLGEGADVPPTIADRAGDGVEPQLRSYLRKFRDADLTPLVVDLTPEDVRELGYTVVRVVVPELVDLTLPSLPAVDHPSLSGRVENSRPHPFP